MACGVLGLIRIHHLVGGGELNVPPTRPRRESWGRPHTPGLQASGSSGYPTSTTSLQCGGGQAIPHPRPLRRLDSRQPTPEKRGGHPHTPAYRLRARQAIPHPRPLRSAVVSGFPPAHPRETWGTPPHPRPTGFGLVRLSHIHDLFAVRWCLDSRQPTPEKRGGHPHTPGLQASGSSGYPTSTTSLQCGGVWIPARPPQRNRGGSPTPPAYRLRARQAIPHPRPLRSAVVSGFPPAHPRETWGTPPHPRQRARPSALTRDAGSPGLLAAPT